MQIQNDILFFLNEIFSHGNDLFEQMYPFQDDADEDLPNELVAALDRKDPIQSNINDDESVFSDVVQDAFKKYQNEVQKKNQNMNSYSKYWTYNDTVVKEDREQKLKTGKFICFQIWDNRFSEDEVFALLFAYTYCLHLINKINK